MNIRTLLAVFLENKLAKKATKTLPILVYLNKLIKVEAKSGATSSAPSIIRPWKKSVQHTAEKPPKKV